MNQNQNNGKKEPGRPPVRMIVTLAVVALVVTILFNMVLSGVAAHSEEKITYTEFLQMVEDGQIESVEFGTDRINIFPKEEVEGISDKNYYTGYIVNFQLNDLIAKLDRYDVGCYGEVAERTNPILSFIVSWVLPIAVMYLLFMLLMRGMSKHMGGGPMGMGQSKAKVYTVEKKTGVTFADVAGQDEAKDSLKEIIDFLHNPQKYAAIGAKLPKGALLVGAPGTGKTLLAKAVAGEAGVPFFSIAGSDFVEMFVGVGASRVRDLFDQASKQAPAIIFIDEIDAIGKSRDSRLGGNDEREQTLNQLLSEIDGFDSSKGVVILAATNRPEILDKALLRAGRFDRRIIVDTPNLEGRYQTLRVHTRNIKLAEDVDLRKVAAATAGAVGADLANLVNEAALRAVRLGRQAVNQQDLLISFELVLAGAEKKGTVLTEMEKRMISYHEVGHALAAALQKHSMPVSKITIVPHTSGALGYTMQLPEEEKFLNSKEELLVELRTLLAGRAAEQTVFGAQTTGAAVDIEKATDLARKMITQYGMSEKFGLMALSGVANQYLDGQTVMNCADSTAAEADTEIRKLLAACYEDAKRILRDNRALLDEIALYLLEKETITGDEFMQYVNADKNRITEHAETSDELPEPSEPS